MKQNCECLNSSSHLYSRRMRFQNICFFLVVTTSLVSAAPAASVVREERAAVQPRVKRSPSLSLSLQHTDFKCSAPGIYADQQTGCQAFHFCQDGGRMDSFFCPNLTLFNQRFFVCDWSYNVDCNSAHLYFSLNDGLYQSQSAQTISNAINQPVGLAQDETLSVQQPQPASLATSSSQRDAQIALDNTIPTSQDQTKQDSQDSPQDSQDSSQDSQVDETPEENPSDSSDGETGSVTTLSSVPDPVLDSASVYYDDVADPEPAAGDTSYVSASLPTYSSSGVGEQSLVYDSADPEPAGYYSDDQSDPEPEAYIDGYSYDSLSDSSYYYGSENSQSADPEPAGYYGVSDNNYPLYQTQGLLYDPSADPEPSSDPEFTPYDS